MSAVINKNGNAVGTIHLFREKPVRDCCRVLKVSIYHCTFLFIPGNVPRQASRPPKPTGWVRFLLWVLGRSSKGRAPGFEPGGYWFESNRPCVAVV